MQILVQVVCSRGPSLRDAIRTHRRLEQHGLHVTEHQRPGRPHGWSKVHSTHPDRHGAINIEWDADTGILLCRVVTRGSGRPNVIIGDFADFLLKHFRGRVQAINIIPRT
jgi:hypothetical protein